MIYVILQFVGIGLLALTSPRLPRNPLTWLLLGIGLGVAGWAIQTMRPERVTALPTPRDDAELLTTGPYALMRHPMYTGIVVGGVGLLLDAPSPLRGLIWLALTVNMILKARHEESLLTAHFPDYADYSARTWRLIPFIY